MLLQTYITSCLLCLCLSALAIPAFAVGTTAGTKVHNTVEVSFRINDDPQVLRVERANEVFTVSEIIRSNVSTLNPEGVATSTPGRDVPLSFQLTNTGNGEEVFRLSPQADSSSDFPAAITRLWIESNGEPGQQSDDTLYDDASGILLQADEGTVVYVVADIPAELADQARGDVVLTATSATDGAAVLTLGEAVPPANNNGVEAVVAQDNASAQAASGYVVSGIQLNVDKTIVSVLDPYAGNLVMPGAAITYQITVSAEGRGVAKDLKINDPTPENMSYRRNTLMLNGEPLSDLSDLDGGHFDEVSNTVWFTPGTINAPLTQLYTLTYVVD